MKKNSEREALIQQAMVFAYTKEADFVRAFSAHSALENMGHSADDQLRGMLPTPEQVHWFAWDSFARDANMEGIDVDDEFKMWEKEARKIVVKLLKKKLPLTVENGNHAWDKTGPFAKKGG